jgi:hypothetical protein
MLAGVNQAAVFVIGTDKIIPITGRLIERGETVGIMLVSVCALAK